MQLVLEQLEYDIDETKFSPGRSFFLPCLAPAKARIQIIRVMELHGHHVFAKVVLEEGISGLRVWKIC